MKRRREFAVTIAGLLVGALSCGTGSTGFDPPPAPPPETQAEIENRVLEDVVGSGACAEVLAPSGGEVLLLCSNDPPAGTVGDSLFVSEPPGRCPGTRCTVHLAVEEAGLGPAVRLLPAWRPAAAPRPWVTADAPLARDPESGARSGELVIPESVTSDRLLVALLVYPDGVDLPSLSDGAIAVETLGELGAPEASILTVTFE